MAGHVRRLDRCAVTGKHASGNDLLRFSQHHRRLRRRRAAAPMADRHRRRTEALRPRDGRQRPLQPPAPGVHAPLRGRDLRHPQRRTQPEAARPGTGGRCGPHHGPGTRDRGNQYHGASQGHRGRAGAGTRFRRRHRGCLRLHQLHPHQPPSACPDPGQTAEQFRRSGGPQPHGTEGVEGKFFHRQPVAVPHGVALPDLGGALK
ncbi:hypothetical protein DESC_660098 [Desulfosarcina cetonica]|nr:hypothetical protein DESC_660098 [Desulfosarcina cetonica]